jgi:hypothetical protein
VGSAHKTSQLFRQVFIRRKKRSLFCADAIFAAYRGPSARTCLSYAVLQVSNEGKSEFSRRPIGSENSGDKKTKQKAARRGSPFLVTFLAKQKSD